MCVHMNDGPYVWVFAFIKSTWCFLKILATTCRIDERKLQAFLGCRRNDFLAVEEMNWMTDNWPGWFNSLLFILSYSVESTEKDIETRLTKAWTAINRLSIIWKSDLTDKMKRSFFQAAVTSILLYGCTTWTLTKRLEKKLDGNYTRMLRAILNKSWRQHPTRHQLYGHLPPITKTIQVRRTRHAGHCWRSRDELIWTPTHGRVKAGRPARTYIQQLCEDTGCCPEDLPGGDER